MEEKTLGRQFVALLVPNNVSLSIIHRYKINSSASKERVPTAEREKR